MEKVWKYITGKQILSWKSTKKDLYSLNKTSAWGATCWERIHFKTTSRTEQALQFTLLEKCLLLWWCLHCWILFFGYWQHLKPEGGKMGVNLKTLVPVSMLPTFSWKESDHVELMISSFPVKTEKPRKSSQEKRQVQDHGGKLFSPWAGRQWRSGHRFGIPVAQATAFPVQTSPDRDRLAGKCRAGCFPPAAHLGLAR